MIRISSLVLITYPEYAAGIRGKILDRETSGRWIVQLESNPLRDSGQPLIVSVEESDFRVVTSHVDDEQSDPNS